MCNALNFQQIASIHAYVYTIIQLAYRYIISSTLPPPPLFTNHHFNLTRNEKKTKKKKTKF